MRSLCILHNGGSWWRERMVKCVSRAGVLNHLDILRRPAKPSEIVAARTNFDIVVRDAVEHSNRMIADLCVIYVSSDARGKQRNVGGRFNSTCIQHLLKSF